MSDKIKGGDAVAVSPKLQEESVGFTDPTSEFTISPGQVKNLPKKMSGRLRAAVAGGLLVRAGSGTPAPADEVRVPEIEQDTGGDKKKGKKK